MHRRFSLLALLIVLALSAGLPSLGSDPQESPASPLFGSLEPYGTGLPQRGQWRNGFAVADMNGDRVPDIVHGPPRKGRGWPVIFIGDGKGGFTRWAASFPRLPFDYGVVAVADFDRDGRADDIAIGSHLRGMAVLTGDGKGEFKQWGQGLELRAPAPGRDIPFCPGALVAVDWNKDGRTDLAGLSEGPARLALRDRMTGGQGGGIRVFLNEARQWRAVVPEEGDESLIGRSLAAGDVDGDHRPDLLAGSATLGFTRLLKRNNTGRKPRNWVPLPVAAQAFVTAVALADFDRNGRADPVIASSVPEGASWRNRVQVHLSFVGRFQTVEITPEGVKSPFRAIATGDMDGDRKLDLAGVTEDGTLILFKGVEKGSFKQVHTEPAPAWRAGCSGYDVHLADLDRDGRDEIVASFAGEASGTDGANRSFRRRDSSVEGEEVREF